MSQIYRYKFSEHFLEELKSFASVHRYDEIPLFREHWDLWLTKNKEAIAREEQTLKTNGYAGDILEKMYKSVRYYYKNKSVEEKKPAERRIYISLNSKIRNDMDEHINSVINNEKPAVAYENYIENIKYQAEYLNEKVRLMQIGIDEADAEIKIKKTYKNRYFMLSSKS